MSTRAVTATLDELVGSLSDCPTDESARRLLALKADRNLQLQLDRLTRRAKSGTLSANELAEYETAVTYGTFVAILKSKVRQILAGSIHDG
jgi:hypothetical protein